MIPGVYEFSWDAGHVIFLGAFYGVLLLIAGSVAIALVQTLRDFSRGSVDSLRWREEFRALPESGRLCRHAMTGELPGRVCPNGFECGRCAQHRALVDAAGGEDVRSGESGGAAAFGGGSPCGEAGASAASISRAAAVAEEAQSAAARAARGISTGFDRVSDRAAPANRRGSDRGSSAASTEAVIAGFSVPMDRRYHRGHTWVKAEPGGDVTVGLDDLATRLVGRPDQVDLPAPGTRIHANGTGWRMRKRGAEVRVLAPVTGEVIETGGPSKGWYLRVRPAPGAAAYDPLLSGDEIAPWILREVERLQVALRPTRLGPMLADGGLPVRKLWRAIPEEDRDAVLGAMLLDP